MLRKILVPTDGSALSAKALRFAVRLARAEKARVVAFHVIAPFRPPAYIDGVIPYPELYSPEEYRKSTARYSQKLLARAQATARKAGVKCESLAVTADPVWRAIIKSARARRCDLIVMASHGRRGIAAVVLGSETVKVLTHSKIPVLVTR